MSKYRIIFSDIDGTLLDSRHRIPDSTVEYIQQLDVRGVPFVLVSARMPDGIYSIQNMLGVCAPIVAYSGALVLDKNKNTLSSTGIAIEKAIEIKSTINKNWPEIACCPYYGSKWIVDDMHNRWVQRESKIVDFLPVQGDMRDILVGQTEIHKFLCMGDPFVMDLAEPMMHELFADCAVGRSNEFYIEIMSKSVSKSAGMKTVCKAAGFSAQKAIAFGDHRNDADMIAAAGLGVAMAGAPADVRNIADIVTADNDHEGVLAVLEKQFGTL